MPKVFSSLQTISDSVTSVNTDFFFKEDSRFFLNGAIALAATIRTTVAGPFNVTFEVLPIYDTNDRNVPGAQIIAESTSVITKTFTVTNSVGAQITVEWDLGAEPLFLPCIGFNLKLLAVTPGAGETQTIDVVAIYMTTGR